MQQKQPENFKSILDSIESLAGIHYSPHIQEMLKTNIRAAIPIDSQHILSCLLVGLSQKGHLSEFQSYCYDYVLQKRYQKERNPDQEMPDIIEFLFYAHLLTPKVPKVEESKFNKILLLYAIFCHKSGLIQHLIDVHSAGSYEALQDAAKYGDLFAFKALFDKFCPPSGHGNLFKIAAENGSLQVICYLMSLCGPKQIDADDVIVSAAIKGQTEIVQYMLNRFSLKEDTIEKIVRNTLKVMGSSDFHPQRQNYRNIFLSLVTKNHISIKSELEEVQKILAITKAVAKDIEGYSLTYCFTLFYKQFYLWVGSTYNEDIARGILAKLILFKQTTETTNLIPLCNFNLKKMYVNSPEHLLQHISFNLSKKAIHHELLTIEDATEIKIKYEKFKASKFTMWNTTSEQTAACLTQLENPNISNEKRTEIAINFVRENPDRDLAKFIWPVLYKEKPNFSPEEIKEIENIADSFTPL